MQIKKYVKIWFLMAVKVSQVALASRFSTILFIVGKLLRFSLYLIFLFMLGVKVKTVGEYSLWQMAFFFATFNIIDVTAQFFLRDVYNFRLYIQSGNFDYYLLKPFSPLFRSLFGGTDILDLPMMVISILLITITASHLGSVSFFGILLYFLLLLNALCIAIAFHIFVIAMGVISTEVDSALWLYRDLTLMGRIPVDIYTEPVRAFLTFVIPIGIMMTVPAKALMGLLTLQVIGFSLLLGAMFFFASLLAYRYALLHYTSVSS